MKKRAFLFLTITICVCLFTGCQCEHEWEEANCISPATCKKCEFTEGEARGHDWQDATCSSPKNCLACGATEGDSLPHHWEEATCTTAKTCSDCGVTEGEILPHQWEAATCKVPKTCTVCALTEGEPSDHIWSEDSTEVRKTCSNCGKLFEYYYGKSGERLLVWTEFETDSEGNLINLVSYGTNDEDDCVQWIQDGEVKCWEIGERHSVFFPEMYHVEGKIYYRQRPGGGVQRARKLANIARKYVSFKGYWSGDGDHIDLANTNDFWEIIDNPLGCASCAVDIDGTKYVIVHKGHDGENPLDTYAVKYKW